MTDTDWLALADFLDAHANDMRAWTEDEPKFRATAEGLRQLAAITAERDAAVARAAQLGTGIDSVRSHWHADEGPRWTANVIEALRHSGLMDDVMLSGTPDPDPGPNTLADRLDVMSRNGYNPDAHDDLRAAADGLRQYAAITTADKNWRTLKALYDEHLRVVRAERDEARDQYAAITAAIGDPEQLRKAAQALSIHYRRHAAGDYLRRIAAAAASLSPTPTPQHCPTCGSTNRDRVKPNDCEIIPDAWHDSGQP